MDILTLELGNVTVSGALLAVKAALERHPDLPLRILVEGDEMIRLNLERFLGREGRAATFHPEPRGWRLEVPPGFPRPSAPVSLHPAFSPAISESSSTPPSALLLRSAFAPGDRSLGRHLLLGVLESLPEGMPCLYLAHEAIELLQDPRALSALHSLQARGVQIQVSAESLRYFQVEGCPFPSIEDRTWQTLYARGALSAL